MLFMGILLWGVRLLSILLSLFERCLKPSHHVELSIREAAAFEASLRSQSEALSRSMWVLSALLAFVLLQHFVPEDSSLFNTLVTSLSKSFAGQASLTVTHTAFLGLKRHQFYLSHLPSYFSDVNKHAMLSSPVVLASSLFSEQDVARLLADTQMSSSLLGLSRLWLMLLLVVPVLTLVDPALRVLLLALLHVAAEGGLGLRLAFISACASILWIRLRLCGAPGRVLANRGHVLRPP